MPKPCRPRTVALAAVFAGAALLGACRDSNTTSEAPQTSTTEPAPSTPQTSGGGIFHWLFEGADENTSFSSSGAAPTTANPGQIGVNLYLWRAALDTISFMPVASADPFGGVIITDWYSPPESPTERFKINIFILDRQLRSDGIRATVFRQSQGQDGRWIDSPVDAKTASDFENSILTRARQLRIANIKPQ
jgi:hypothetical protein